MTRCILAFHLLCFSACGGSLGRSSPFVETVATDPAFFVFRLVLLAPVFWCFTRFGSAVVQAHQNMPALQTFKFYLSVVLGDNHRIHLQSPQFDVQTMDHSSGLPAVPQLLPSVHLFMVYIPHHHSAAFSYIQASIFTNDWWDIQLITSPGYLGPFLCFLYTWRRVGQSGPTCKTGLWLPCTLPVMWYFCLLVITCLPQIYEFWNFNTCNFQQHEFIRINMNIFEVG